jgi:hypothetical protein
MPTELQDAYRAFAVECGDDSPTFADWAEAVADDPAVLAWIAALPEEKRQPNLVFAAARWHGAAAPGPYDGLRRTLLTDGDAVRRTVLARSTQTNEPGRLAVLLPVLSRIAEEVDGPLALVEVGASAGLCLYPDRYGYDWGNAGSLPADGPVLRCDAAGPLPVPATLPEVAWRGGSDLNPLDATDEDALRWLRTLVWPEQTRRRELLTRAAAITAASPPRLVRGDLLASLDAVIAAAAPHGTVVVFHSAVLAYLSPHARQEFAARMAGLVEHGGVRWISNEGDRVLPGITRTARRSGRPTERFVLGLDGRAVAWAHGHGASLTWLG